MNKEDVLKIIQQVRDAAEKKYHPKNEIESSVQRGWIEACVMIENRVRIHD